MSKEQPDITRVERSRAEARQAYNAMSRWYDLLAGWSEREYRERGQELLAVREGERVLEIGPGTGHALVDLARAAGRPGHVYGIDIAEGMIAVARERVREAGLAERVTPVLGDGARLPFRSSSFDALFMSFTLELFDTPHIPLVLGECRRVLRPEGRLGVVSLSKASGGGLTVQLYEWVHEQFPKYVDCRPILVQHAMEQAGFSIQNAEQRRMWGLPVKIVVGENRPSL
jgi:demethylmenaquinone methyltransferase/2-methoxy-6-polyprenyl-1,4-benzoquinol methylase